jgi:hypothetical protein
MAFDEASESTRREYAARMNRVIDHIQKHLNDQLELDHLAAVACFGPFRGLATPACSRMPTRS